MSLCVVSMVLIHCLAVKRVIRNYVGHRNSWLHINKPNGRCEFVVFVLNTMLLEVSTFVFVYTDTVYNHIHSSSQIRVKLHLSLVCTITLSSFAETHIWVLYFLSLRIFFIVFFVFLVLLFFLFVYLFLWCDVVLGDFD